MSKHPTVRVILTAMLLAACSGGDDGTGPDPNPPAGGVATIAGQSANSVSNIMLGQTLQLSASARDASGNPVNAGTFTWSSSNTQVATVDANGLVTPVGGGDAVISASASGRKGDFSLRVQGSLHSTNVTTNENWRAVDSPHLVTRAIVVGGASSPVLTIEPGATVRFANGAGIEVGGAAVGSLKAAGTVAAPITMVSDAASPTKGAWIGLRFMGNSGPSELRNLTMSHCGAGSGNEDACLFLEGASTRPVVERVTIQNSGAYGVNARLNGGFGAGSTVLNVSGSNNYAIRIGANEAGSIPAGGTVTGNNPDRLLLRDSRVTTSQTWPNIAPYVALQDIIVEAAGAPVLTLLPGTEIRMEAGRYFAIGTCGSGGPGTLIANGTAAQPIKWTANAALPAPGHWAALLIGCTATSNTRISNAIVEYGGGISPYAAFTGNVLVENDIGAFMTDAVIRFSKDCGLIRRSPLITWNTDFTAASLRNTFTSNARMQCGP